jgi:hypothetical protein
MIDIEDHRHNNNDPIKRKDDAGEMSIVEWSANGSLAS